MELANEFFKVGEKFPLKTTLHEDSTEVASEALTKLTKPTSSGVASVLSVTSGQDEFDDRVVCTDCKNFRYGHCNQHVRAGIGNSSKVAINLVSLPQRCPAFAAKC